MSSLRVFLDADSCPADVRSVVLRRSRSSGFPVEMVANRSIGAPEGGRVTMTVVGPDDTADDHIIRNARPGDIVVTRDIPLAEILALAGVTVLNDRGEVFTAEMVRERRSLRDFSMALKSAGLRLDRDSRRGPKETKRFSDAFDRTLARLGRDAGT